MENIGALIAVIVIPLATLVGTGVAWYIKSAWKLQNHAWQLIKTLQEENERLHEVMDSLQDENSHLHNRISSLEYNDVQNGKHILQIETRLNECIAENKAKMEL